MTGAAQNIALLGATGSIGTSTVKVVRQHPDRYAITSAAVYSNTQALSALLQEFPITTVCIWDENAAESFRAPEGVQVFTGMEGLLQLASDPQTPLVVNGLVGSIGCQPTLEAIRHGKTVGLANKETMVMAGEVIRAALNEHPESSLVPIDSEHSAIFQCLAGRPASEVESLILTASGGPFRTLPPQDFAGITLQQALNHPTWNMGPKITIDSATMMNKGLEVIEAHYLFDVPIANIDIVIHPTSTVHSFVQFRDGSLMAQLGSPDMQLPILYALSHPERLPLDIERLDVQKMRILEFFPPDPVKFPCIRLAYEAARRGGTAPAIVNAANEVAVDAFLKEKIAFSAIPQIIEEVLGGANITENPDLNSILKSDAWARASAGAAAQRKRTHA